MTSVIINDVIPRTQSLAVGPQTVYSTNWTADVASDVKVFSRAGTDAPNDDADLLPPSAYTVAFIGSLRTVQVTLLTPSVSGDIVTITRETPVDRDNLYTNTNFTPTMLNGDFGRFTLMVQENDMFERQLTPSYPESAIINDFDLNLPILGPGESWVMNESGSGIIAAIAGGSSAEVLALLASHDPGEGASLIGLEGTGTVQDLAEAPFIVKTANAATPNAQALGALTTGILKSTTLTGVVSISAPLTSIDGLVTATNQMIYTTAPDVYATTTLTPFARTVLDDADAASAAATLQVLPLSGGTMTGQIDMGGSQIVNAADPTTNQALATKFYVDNALGGSFLPLSGGTMSGVINMGNNKITNLADPSLNQDAVTLFYLNGQLTNYLQKSGGTMTGQINMNSNKIIGVTDPTNAQDAATKAYVDLVATGLSVQAACYAATTANLNATYANGASGIGATLTNAGALAAFSTDGESPPTNARILVWMQSNAFENGIYTLTNQGSGAVAWVLTRAADYDQPSEIQPGDLIVVQNGTLYATTSFIETATVSAVGTDAIDFTQFTFSPTSFLLKSNNLSDVASLTDSFNNISPLTTKGDLIAFDGSDNVRLPVGGSDGQILRVKAAATNGFDWSTATYPDTTTINQILYSSATNTVTGLATANGGVLVTSNTGVPQMLANPGAANRILLSGSSAAPTWSAYTVPTAVSTSGKLMMSDGTNIVMSTPTYPNLAGTSGKLIMSDGTNFITSTPTYPNTAGTSGKLIASDGTNFVTSTATFPVTAGAAGTFIRSDGTNWIASTPTLPTSAGTSGKILQSNGTNFVESTPTYPSASGTARTMIVSNGTNNVYSTETWAVPGASGNVLTSDGTNWTSAAPSSGSTSGMFADARLTLTSGVPVTTSNVTAATSVYFTPYAGNQYSVYNGATWVTRTFNQITITVPATTSTIYDVFAYDNAGTLAIDTPLAWSSDTARATALTTQDGILVKSGDATRRYVGSFRTTTVSGQTEDSLTKRYIWNYYNRVVRPLLVQESNATWNYSLTAFRQTRASTANQVDIVIGFVEDMLWLMARGWVGNSTSTARICVTGIGLGSTTVNSANIYEQITTTSVNFAGCTAYYNALPPLGRQFFTWLESGAGTDTQSWFGTTAGGRSLQTGMSGFLLG